MDIGVLRRDGRTDPFFDGTAAERLMIKRCEPCDRWYAPDVGNCAECGSEELTWAQACGDAKLVTWTVLHPRSGDGEVQVLALVELAEGPWMHTRLYGVEGDEPYEGMPLRVMYVHPDEGESFALFTRA
jgi:uncharacterized OB-fold protein